LSDRFVSDWAKESKEPASRTISETLHPVPLKDRITTTVYRLNMVHRKLEDSRLRMDQKYKTLFNKCVKAQEGKDSATAVMYANECGQIKKMIQILITSQLAMEQVVLRLETVKDFGDVAAEIIPAAGVIRSVKGRLAGVIPEVSMQLGMIGQTLDSLVLEVGEATGSSWSSIAQGEDAERILSEASTIADQKVRDGFPDLPSTSTAEKGVNPL
jgi:division protein CdvB (Snf7/Vps24/ESCRT-III family)